MTCPRCQQENLPTMKFCGECGTALQQPQADALPVRSYADLQRVATEALEQQTATAEILRVISSSQTDVQPVFDTIVRSARRLCDAFDAVIYRRDGDTLHLVAHEGPIPPASMQALIRGWPPGRAVLDGRTVHIADMQAEVDEFPEGSEIARRMGNRTVLSMPLMRKDGLAIGAIMVRRTEARLFTDRQVALLQTFADQAVIAIENVRLFTELEARNRDLTATSDILQVIASSPTDTQPVFDAIARSVVQLCEGLNTYVFLLDGEHYKLVASLNASPDTLAYMEQHFPGSATRGSTWGRAVLGRAVVHIPDVTMDPDYEHMDVARADNYRSVLAAPLLRQGIPIGAISVARRSPFSVKQIELVKTFADQAVIAIENVRLFNETKEALEQQTATAEILQVISGSPTDLQPRFATIVRSASRRCDAFDAVIYRRHGDTLHLVAHEGPIPTASMQALIRGWTPGRAILDGRAVHIADLQAEVDEFPEGSEIARRVGNRTVLSMPLMGKDDLAIGAIMVRRTEARLFTDRQVALLQTFADQAVIAIENVRLFTELQEKNLALTTAHSQVTEALERQTATSDILKVISSSPTDLQPVFDIIAESAVRLCEAEVATVTRFDGEWVHLGAIFGSSNAGIDALRHTFPMRPSGAGGAARAVRDRTVVHIPDVLADHEYRIQDTALTAGFRAILGVPMLRDGGAIGAIALGRSRAGEYSETQIQLLRTFADQAAIAIENVRLFKELETRNRDLTETLEQQTATSDILRVISSSPTDVQPVFDSIAQSALQLCD